MSTPRFNRRVAPSLWRLLLAGLLLAALLPAAGALADDPPAPADLPADVYASVLQQVKQLTADDGAKGDNFGFSVAISGDTVVVGVLYDNVGSAVDQGAAYVFGRNQGGAGHWGLVKKLLADDGAGGDNFGVSVAIDGDTIIVGAPDAHVGATENQGAAYVFYRNQGGANNWGQVKRLVAGDGSDGDEFGGVCAISGDTIVVAAFSDTVGAEEYHGSAYVFDRDQGGADQWGEVKHLAPDDGAAWDTFGVSVGISGDTIVVGAPYHEVGGNGDQGAAYIYRRDQDGANQWGLLKQLLAGDGGSADRFGYSVGIDGDTIVVGAPWHYVGITEQGSAYVLYRNQGGTDNWGQVKELAASDGAEHDTFGWSAAIAGDSIVLGAKFHYVGGVYEQGSAYLFQRNQSGADQWGQVKQFVAGDGARADRFGSSIAISGVTIVVGAPEHNVGDNPNQGSAYIFQDVTAKLKLRKTDQRDPIPAGWVVRYTIDVTNAGNGPLSLITVVDTLPPKTVFVQAGQGGRRVSNRVTWKLQDVPAGTTVQLSVWLRTYTTMRGYILNQVTATAEGVTAKAGQSTLIVAPTVLQQPAEDLPAAD